MQIQTAVYKLKQRYPRLFEEYLFDTNGHYPFSNKLRGELSRLKLSGILSLNPGKAPYGIEVGEDNLRNLEGRERLEQIADELYDLIKIDDDK